ncbi:MAG: hypothetical protein WC554_10305 [Clostridia bacterium]|jgi:hypothetical protein
MFIVSNGSVNGDDCYLDSAILQRAEELSLISTGRRFADLDKPIAFQIWLQAEAQVSNIVAAGKVSAS